MTSVRTPRKTSKRTVYHPKDHYLHRHRPVVTLGVGLLVILLIGAAVLANTRIRNSIQATLQRAEEINIDTTDWQYFVHPDTPVSFRYPAEWSSKLSRNGEDTLISLTQNGQVKTSLYASPSGYLGFEGLPQQPTVVGNFSGVRISEALAGFTHNNVFYTLDAGLDPDSSSYFQEIIKTITIK